MLPAFSSNADCFGIPLVIGSATTRAKVLKTTQVFGKKQQKSAFFKVRTHYAY
jgi:hypothetical protein